jgi:hypothetical protein
MKIRVECLDTGSAAVAIRVVITKVSCLSRSDEDLARPIVSPDTDLGVGEVPILRDMARSEVITVCDVRNGLPRWNVRDE